MTHPEHHHRVLGTTAEWLWFLRNGPHGPSFTWHRNVPGYSGINHLREIVAERSKSNPAFGSKVREIALEALGFEETDLIRRAIQVLCVIGESGDLEKIMKFLEHPDSEVQRDAKACLFERGIKIKTK